MTTTTKTNVNPASERIIRSVPGLRDKAITVKLVRRMWNPYKFDAGATDAAELAAGTHKAGRFNKRLLRNCKELRAATGAYQAVYEYVVDNTLPWMDDGLRVLPNANYFDFVAGLNRLKAEADARVRKLAEVWPVATAEDRKVLLGMWDPNDYPTVGDMESRWSITVRFAPIAVSDDFRIDMDDTARQALDDAVNQVEEDAAAYLLRRLMEPVAAMVTKLSVPIGDEGSVFRDTLVSNVRDVCKRARGLNINDDERVNEVIDDIEHVLAHVDAQSLRESSTVRETTASRMKDVQTKINQWF